MNINNRLKNVSNMVKERTSILDIGCDHALLDIYLAKNKKLKKIVASDNKEGPITIANENVKKYQLQNEIEIRLGDGLDIYTNDINTIIISGMGGRLIIGIIKNHLEYLKSIDTFILSPNNYQKEVRDFLTKSGYFIDEEVMVKEGKIIYQIIRFVKGKKKYSKRELFFGPKLLENKNKLFYEYYERELAQSHIILGILPKGHLRYKMKIKRKIKLLEDELKEK